MLGKRIQLLRMERGWTQAELAKKLNITKKAVKNWESGSSKPSVDCAIRLADIFGISTDSLFERERRTQSIWIFFHLMSNAGLESLYRTI